MKRIVLGVVLPVGWLALAIVPFLVAWDRLPEPLATHWLLGGAPNGAMSRAAAVALHGSAAVMAAVTAWRVTRPGAHVRAASAACAMAAFIGALFALTAIAVVLANLDAPTWHDARPQSLLAATSLVGAAAVIAAVVSRAARELDAPAAPAVRATVGLAAGERAMWTAGAHNGWFAAFAVISAAVGIVGILFARPGGVAIAPALIIAVVCAACTELHARVDERGLSIAFGPWRFPRMRIAIGRIESARRVEIEPLARGGWGYRGSLTIFGRAAAIVRRGEGVELRLAGGKIFAVTVDDAATAAGLLNDLAARAQRTRT